MRQLLLCCMVLCVPSLALCNPVVHYDAIYMDTGSGSPCLWPAPGDTFTVTLYLTNLWYGSGGMLYIEFGMQRTFGGSELAVHNLYGHVGGLSFGDPEIAPGFAMTTGPCAYPNSQGAIPFATVKYLYTGPPGTLTPIPHQGGGFGIYFADCNNEPHQWCIDQVAPGSIAGIGVVPPLGCGASAVAGMTWGTIKALYR